MLKAIQKIHILIGISFLLAGCSTPALQPAGTPITLPIATPSPEAAQTSPESTATEPAS